MTSENQKTQKEMVMESNKMDGDVPVDSIDQELIDSAQKVLDWTTANGAFTGNLRPLVEHLSGGDVRVRGIKWSPQNGRSTTNESSKTVQMNAGDVIASIPSHIVISERVCLQSQVGKKFMEFLFVKRKRWLKLTHDETDVYAAGLIMLCGFLVLEKYVVPELEAQGKDVSHLTALDYSCCSEKCPYKRGSNGEYPSKPRDPAGNWTSYCRCYYPGKYTKYVKSLPETYELPIVLFAEREVPDSSSMDDSQTRMANEFKSKLFEQLFGGTAIEHIVKGRVKILKTGFKYLTQCCGDMFVVDENKPSELTFQNLVWAYCAISSRAFPQEIGNLDVDNLRKFMDNITVDQSSSSNVSKDLEAYVDILKNFYNHKGNELCLYPSLDYLNHKRNEKITWNIGTIPKYPKIEAQTTTDSDDGCGCGICAFKHKYMESESVEFVTKTETPIVPGDILYNNYGSKGNENLITNYGFCLDENPEDYVKLSLNINDMDSTASQKRDILEAIYGNSSRWIHMIFMNKHSTFGFNDQLIDFEDPTNFPEDIVRVSRVVGCISEELDMIVGEARAIEQNKNCDTEDEHDCKRRRTLNDNQDAVPVENTDLPCADALKDVISHPLTARNELSTLLTLRKLLNIKLNQLNDVSDSKLEVFLKSDLLRKTMDESGMSLDYMVHMSKVYREGQRQIILSNIFYLDQRLNASFCTSLTNSAIPEKEKSESVNGSTIQNGWYVPEDMKAFINVGKFVPISINDKKMVSLTEKISVQQKTYDNVLNAVIGTLKNMLSESNSLQTIPAKVANPDATQSDDVNNGDVSMSLDTSFEGCEFDEFAANILLLIEFVSRNLNELNLEGISQIMNVTSMDRTTNPGATPKIKWGIPNKILDAYSDINGGIDVAHFQDFVSHEDKYDAKNSSPAAELNDIDNFFENELKEFITPFLENDNSGFYRNGTLIDSTTFKWGYELIDRFSHTFDTPGERKTIVFLPSK